MFSFAYLLYVAFICRINYKKNIDSCGPRMIEFILYYIVIKMPELELEECFN